MKLPFLTVLLIPILASTGTGAAPQRLKPQCRANVCDDRPECPRSSCNCLFASRMDCAIYYQCINGKPHQYRCSPGLLFNVETLSCDYSYNVNCSFSTTVATSTSTTVTTPEEPTTIKTTEASTTIKTTEKPTTIKTTEEPTTSKRTEEPTTTETTEKPTTTKTTEEPTTTVTTEEPTTTETTEKPTTTKTTEEPTTTVTTEEPTTTETTEKPTTTKTTEEPTTTVTTEEPTTTETTEKPTTSKTTEEVTTTVTTEELTTNKATEPTTTTTEQPTTIKTTEVPTTTETTERPTPTQKTEEPVTSKTTAPTTTETTNEPTTTKTSEEATTVETTIKVLTTTKRTETTSPNSTPSEIQTVSTPVPSSDFLCPTRFGLFPDPKSCFRFYHCSHWIPYHKWCPSNLHFNPKLKVCDWPYRAGCDTILPTPYEPNSPMTPKANDTYDTCDCDCCELPVPGDCNAYVLCIDKVAFKMSCSPGLYFNPMTGTCDYQDNVVCAEDDFSCPQKSGRYLLPGSCSYFVECHHGEKTVNKCPEGLQFNQSSEMCSWLGSCSGQQPDDEPGSKTIADIAICNGCEYCFKPVAEDCSSYVKCLQNIATEERCAAGLFFTPDTEMCDHDYNVECPEPQPQPECPQNFGYFPYPGECGKYLQCINASAVVKSCPGILHFDPVKKHCDYPWAAGCSDSDPEPTSEPTTEIVECDCECCLKPVGTDCRSFVLCINKIGFERSCSSGLRFNPRTENCDFAENVNCDITPEIPEYYCPEHQGLFPHPDDCHKFIHCAHGFPYVKDCPSNLHFNPRQKVCDWPYSAGCKDSQTIDPSIDDGDLPCDICDSCFIPDEADCASYIYCRNGKSHRLRCTDNLLFNPDTESCDFASNVKCPNQPQTKCSKPDGLFPAEDCSQFIHCSNGIAYLKDCPDRLQFNPQLLVCDWPENVKCGEIPVVPTPSDDGSDSLNITCDCDCCFLPRSNDCSKYILCLDGYAHEGQCSRGLMFNPSIQNCDLAERVTCGEESPLCPEPNGLFPNPNQCSSYIKCFGGVSEVEYCQNGTHFSSESEQCTDPCKAKCDNSYDCTTKPGYVTPSPVPLICLEQDGFYPVTNDCTSFYVCSYGQPQRVKCPDGLHYNAEYETCEDPCDAKCDQSLDCGISPATSPGTTPSPSPSTPDPNCLQGNGLYPVEGDCSSFYHCSDGRAYRIKCPPGLHFSYNHQLCEYPCEAKCNSSLDCSTPGTSPKTTPKPSPSTPDPHCPQGDGLYPDERDCSSFYQCSGGRSYRKKCPTGLHFSYKHQVCEYPCVAQCNSSIDCSTLGTSPKTTPSPSPSTPDPHCPQGDGLYPDERDCSSFYQCSGGRSYHKKCPTGLHFSYKHQVCEYPCVAQCNSSIDCSTSGTSPKTTPSPSPSTPDPHCPQGDGLYPDERDCSSFYQCSGGRSYRKKCPSGLHFSYKHKVCEYPCVAQCNSSIDCSTPGTSPKTTPSPSPSTPDPHCPQGDGLYHDERDCSSFYQCSGGRSYRKKCPTGLHFSYKHQVCEYPCVAQCNSSIDCSTTTPKPISTPSPHCPTADGLYPVLNDCAAFHLCSSGKEYLIHCPPGLHYSEKHEICEHPCVAQCNVSLDCDASTRPVSSSTTPHPTSPECDEPDGLFPNPDDCGSFYQCSSGRSHLVYCPSGLHFSEDDSACEKPCTAGCDISIDCPPEYPDTEGNCTCDACYLPDPSDCSAFYFCDNSRLAKGYCPFGTLFSKISSVCDDESTVDCEANGDPSMCPERFGFYPYPGDCKKFVHCDNGVARIKECKGGLEYDPQSRVCTKPKGYCGDPEKDPNCPEPTGLFPDPSDCSLFYHCEHGVAYPKRCSPPLVFNPGREVCDWPENVACGRNNTTEVSTPSTRPNYTTPGPTPSPTPTSPACYEVPGVICPCACRVPTFDECNSYLQCQEDGTACKRFCPEGLYFNKIEMVCDLPENVHCRDFFFTSIRRAKYLNHHPVPAKKLYVH